MRISCAPRRAFPALVYAIVFASFGSAAPTAAPYQAIIAMLDQMSSKGAESSLGVVIEALVIGDEDGGKTADRLISSEKTTIESALTSHFDATPGFRLVGMETRPFAPIPDKFGPGAPAYSAALADDDKVARGSRDDARFLIIVRIIDYHSGRYDLAETRSQLMDRIGGNKLALDVAWSSRVDGVERSLFVDGARVK